MDHKQVLEKIKKESSYYVQKEIDNLIDSYIKEHAIFTIGKIVKTKDTIEDEKTIVDIIMSGSYSASNPSGIKYKLESNFSHIFYEISQESLIEKVDLYKAVTLERPKKEKKNIFDSESVGKIISNPNSDFIEKIIKYEKLEKDNNIPYYTIEHTPKNKKDLGYSVRLTQEELEKRFFIIKEEFLGKIKPEIKYDIFYSKNDPKEVNPELSFLIFSCEKQKENFHDILNKLDLLKLEITIRGFINTFGTNYYQFEYLIFNSELALNRYLVILINEITKSSFYGNNNIQITEITKSSFYGNNNIQITKNTFETWLGFLLKNKWSYSDNIALENKQSSFILPYNLLSDKNKKILNLIIINVIPFIQEIIKETKDNNLISHSGLNNDG